MCLQESIPVECQQPACQPYVLHNEQECIPVGCILTDGQTQLKILPSLTKDKLVVKQECIRVGCIPSAAVAVSPARHACMPPCHVCPHHTPRAMHALHHACPPATHAPPIPCKPPSATHAPLPCMPPSATHPPAVNRITDRCKNIAFPQLLLRTVTKLLTLCSREPLRGVSILRCVWGWGEETRGRGETPRRAGAEETGVHAQVHLQNQPHSKLDKIREKVLQIYTQ